MIFAIPILCLARTADMSNKLRTRLAVDSSLFEPGRKRVAE